MIVIDINLMDGGHPIPIAVSNYVQAMRINTFMREVRRVFDEMDDRQTEALAVEEARHEHG